MLIVNTHRHPVALEELCTLIERDTQQCVLRAEIPLSGVRGISRTVVNLMSSEVGIEADGTAGLVIMILDSRRHHAASDPLVGIVEWGRRAARLAGIEMRDIRIDIRIPVRMEVVTQFQVPPILLETHAGAVIVGAPILCCHRTGELAAAHLVRSLCLDSAVAASPQIDRRLHTILMHSTGHDIDDTPHGIRAIEHGGRTAQHLHPLGHQCLVTVGDRMPVDTVILRMTVDEYHQLTTAASDAPQVDAPCGTAGDPIAQHGTAGDEESGHLLHGGGQDTCLILFCECLTTDDRDRHRQIAHVGGVTGTRHHDILQVHRVGDFFSVDAGSHRHQHQR